MFVFLQLITSGQLSCSSAHDVECSGRRGGGGSDVIQPDFTSVLHPTQHINKKQRETSRVKTKNMHVYHRPPTERPTVQTEVVILK